MSARFVGPGWILIDPFSAAMLPVQQMNQSIALTAHRRPHGLRLCIGSRMLAPHSHG